MADGPDNRMKREDFRVEGAPHAIGLSNDSPIAKRRITEEPGQGHKKTTDAFLSQGPRVYDPSSQYQPRPLSPMRQQFFSGSLKQTFQAQLDRDIRDLQKTDRRPEIYTTLLRDLQMIKEELPRITFSSLSGNDASMERFESNSNTLFMPQRARAESTMTQSTIVHGMDHALTANQRTSHSNPEFAFGLDFSRPPNKVLQYNAAHVSRDAPRGSIFGKVRCATAEGRATGLADEVSATQTEARYLLFRLGTTPKELNQIRRARDQRSVANILSPKIYAATGESQSREDVRELLFHYFGRGGESGRGDLTDLVQDAYARAGDPRFVDAPGCVPITK